MTEMWTSSLKYTLAVILVTCSLFVGSDTYATQNGFNTGAFSSASANAFAGAGTPANAFARTSASANANAGADLSALNNANGFTGAFRETGLVPRDERTEIRSYNNRGFPYDNNANRATKSYSTPSGGVGGFNDKRGGGRNYNKNGERFRCKWEDDDYWEKVETEGDGNECETGDDGDDGQYRPEKYDSSDDVGEFKKIQPELQPPVIHTFSDDIGEFKKIELELQPPLIQKTINTYSNSETREFGSSSENDFLTNTRYTGKTDNFGTTPKYEPGWKYPFASTLKPPGYGNAAASTFGTIPSSQPTWNRETASNSFNSLPTWDSGRDMSASFGTTSKPITNWNTGSGVTANAATNAAANAAVSATANAAANAVANSVTKVAANAAADSFSSTRKSETFWNKNDGIPAASFSTTAKPAPEWNIVIYDSSAGRIPPPHKPTGTPWNLGHGTTSKPGVNWNTGFGSNPESNWRSDYRTTTPAIGTSGKQVPVKAGVTSVHIGLMKNKPLSSDISVAAPHTESVIAPLGSYGSQFGTQNANTYAGAYAGASGTSGIASNSYGGASDVGRKDHSFEFDKPYSGINQLHSNSGSALGITSGNTFGNTKRLHGEITGTSSSSTNSARQDSILNSGKSRESLTGGSLHSESTKSNGNGNGFTNTKSWLNSAPTGSGSSTLRDSGTTGPEFLISNIGSATTKSPFNYVTMPGLTSPFSGTRSNNLGQSGFNFGSNGATANAAANAAASARKSASTFGTSLGTHSTTGIAGTAPGYSSVYSGVKGSSGSVRPGYGTVPLGTNLNIGTNAWSKQSENEGKATSDSGNSGSVSGIWSATSGIRPAGHSENESKILIGAQSIRNNPWLNKVVSGKNTFGITGDTLSAVSGIRPAGHSENESKTLIGEQSIRNNPWLNKVVSGKSTFGTTGDTSSATSGIRPAGHSENESKILIGAQSIANNPWLNKQPASGSKNTSGITNDTWSGTSGIRSGEQLGSRSGSTSEGDDDTWNVQNSCSRGLKVPSKTYYPAATGDGNVPSIANTYRPNSSPNTGYFYPKGGSTTPENLAKWNPANPFLIGVKGGNPSTPRPWNSGITTTAKPIGQGNPFLDRSWTTPKPAHGYSDNRNDNRKMISLGQGNIKPIGQGNPFLENAKRREDIQVNHDKGIIPLGGRKPEGNIPFIGSESSGLGGSSSNGQSAGSSASAIASSSSYANVKSDSLSEGTLSQNRNNDGFYSTGGNSPVGGIGGSISASGNTASVNNILGGSSASPGIGIGLVSVPFGTGAGRPGLGESNSAASAVKAYAESHAESHAEAFSQASSFSSSNSFSTSGSNDPQNGNLSSPIGGGGLQNPAASNPWPPIGAQATAFASSSAGNWARNYPTDVKG